MGAKSRELGDLADVLTKAVAKAFEDGAASMRCNVDTLSRALESREKRIGELEQSTKDLLEIIKKVVGTNTELAVLASEEKIKLAKLAGEKEWNQQIMGFIRGPVDAATTAFMPALASKLLPLLEQGDGSPEDEGRAAVVRVVHKILKNPPLLEQLVQYVGGSDWLACVTYLSRQGSAKTANGAAPAAQN